MTSIIDRLEEEMAPYGEDWQRPQGEAGHTRLLELYEGLICAFAFDGLSREDITTLVDRAEAEAKDARKEAY